MSGNITTNYSSGMTFTYETDFNQILNRVFIGVLTTIILVIFKFVAQILGFRSTHRKLNGYLTYQKGLLYALMRIFSGEVESQEVLIKTIQQIRDDKGQM